MSDVKAIIFWMSGVLTPSHSIVLEKSIYELTGKRIDTAVYHKKLSFFRQTNLGLISPEQFYQEVCKAFPTEMAPSILKEKIISLLSVDTQVIGIINRIPEKFEIRLIVDYPDEWYGRISGIKIFQEHFPKEKAIILPNLGYKDFERDFIGSLPELLGLPFEKCLLVDADIKRAVQAISINLPSIIYVDPRRLNREFILRKIIQPVNKIKMVHES